MCQPLVDLKVLAASDSVEGFVLSYTSLLEQAPGITPALLERLITGRADIARADIKEVRPGNAASQYQPPAQLAADVEEDST